VLESCVVRFADLNVRLYVAGVLARLYAYVAGLKARLYAPVGVSA
jgi:hypothetical protein